MSNDPPTRRDPGPDDDSATSPSGASAVALAASFPPRSEGEWRELAEQSLRGRSLERLAHRRPDGSVVVPIRFRESSKAVSAEGVAPGGYPWLRGSGLRGTVPDGSSLAGWDIRQVVADPDPEQARRSILDDLAAGVTSIELRLDRAGRAGRDAAVSRGTCRGGVTLSSVDDLDQMLEGVLLDVAPLSLDAGAAFQPMAALTLALLQRRGHEPTEVSVFLGADPLGVLARGPLPQGARGALAQLAELAAVCVASWPGVRSARVSTEPFHEAGASDAQELACALGTGLAYLRAMTAAGVSLDRALGQFVFRLALDGELFAGIAKLRTLRLLWARIVAECASQSGLETPVGLPAPWVEAAPARRALTRRDPWINLLRVTAATFAGAVGGADTVVAVTFDESREDVGTVAVPSDLGRRLARNTSHLLMEEAHVHRVADPGGGSWHLEGYGRELAESAWQELQAIESAGGMLAALSDGSLASRIDDVAQRRATDVASRRRVVTGVSEFAQLDEGRLPSRPRRDVARLAEEASERLSTHLARRSVDPVEELAAEGDEPGSRAVAAALAGATLGELFAFELERLQGADRRSKGAQRLSRPFELRRLAEPFERLRDAADVAAESRGARPQVLAVNLGRLAEYNARLSFATHLLAAGGLELTGPGGDPERGFEDPETQAQELADVARSAVDRGLRIAVLCSSDELYARYGADVARSLDEAGLDRILLAGAPDRPGVPFDRDELERAGVDEFVHLGIDAVGALRRLHACLGIETGGGAGSDGARDHGEEPSR